MTASDVFEIVIIITSLSSFFTCLYNWVFYQEYAAVGYMFPSLYMAAVYSWIFFANPALESRVEWVRYGIIALLIDVILWRRVFKIRQDRKTKL